MYFVTSTIIDISPIVSRERRRHRTFSVRFERDSRFTYGEVSSEALHSLEREMCDMILKRFDTMRNVVVVARQVQPRLPVISFLVRLMFE